MTYSRSRTQHKKKSRRDKRTKLWFMVTGILLCLILIAAASLIQSQKAGNDQANPTPDPVTEQSPVSPAPVQPSPSPTAEPENTGVPETDNDQVVTAPEAPSDSITLALVGDILPAARVLELMKQNGYDYPYRKAKEILEAADITAGNLESAITDRGVAAKNKEFLFRAPPETLPAIKEAGFDYLALANNHTMDYGWEGLSDTIDSLDDVGIAHSGSGMDDHEAFSPAYIVSNGFTVAFISVTRVVPEVSWKADKNTPGLAEAYSHKRAVAAIKAAKETADLVVVMAHWGKERSKTPVEHQTDLAHRFIDAGADLVVGSHPHVLQGFELYKGKWIAYSLGNFVFSTTSDPITSETGVLYANCNKEGDCSLQFHPMFATYSQPAPMESDKAKDLLKRLDALSIGVEVKEDGVIASSS